LQQEEKGREERRTENKQKGKGGNLACDKKKGKFLVHEERGPTSTGSKSTVDNFSMKRRSHSFSEVDSQD
jgi:hypothetical protein